MRRWLAEPLVHFLVAGAALFAVWQWFDRGTGARPDAVRIGPAEVNWLRETWVRQWQRPPDEQELRGLVRDYLQEELLAREARELRLDENDTVVRRRLALKLRFLVEDTARMAEPEEAELRRAYAADRARYEEPARISFTQVFFADADRARQALPALETVDLSRLGDPSLLEPRHDRADSTTVASLFGPQFAAEVFTLEPGTWHGPVQSGYGFHLVHIDERQAARPRAFEEARAQVLEEWTRARQAQAAAEFFAGLLQKYEIVVDESVRPLVGTLAESRR